MKKVTAALLVKDNLILIAKKRLVIRQSINGSFRVERLKKETGEIS
ncbi:hypothetical protein [Petroclostridium xylanilyticum]|nr:hypothetical protein [Petroclostridium xylanilyticum]